MDVRLPDGTIVRNVPDDITQEDLMDRVGLMSQPSQGLTAGRAAEVAGGAVGAEGGPLPASGAAGGSGQGADAREEDAGGPDGSAECSALP